MLAWSKLKNAYLPLHSFVESILRWKTRKWNYFLLLFRSIRFLWKCWCIDFILAFLYVVPFRSEIRLSSTSTKNLLNRSHLIRIASIKLEKRCMLMHILCNYDLPIWPPKLVKYTTRKVWIIESKEMMKFRESNSTMCTLPLIEQNEYFRCENYLTTPFCDERKWNSC